MRSRSRSSRDGNPCSGSAFGRTRLRTLWTVRPTHASGRSVESSTAPRPAATAKKIRPATAVWSRLRSTEPRSSAGIASTGSASTTANASRLTAVSAPTVELPGSPAWTSSLYCSAAPMAPPPGAIFDSALPASWDVITGRQRCARSATCWSAHMHATDAACSAAIAASASSENLVTWRQEPNVWTRLGNTRYSETPVTASQITVLRRPPFGGSVASPRAISLATSVRRSIACSTLSPNDSAWLERLSVDRKCVDHHPVEDEDDERPDGIGAEEEQRGDRVEHREEHAEHLPGRAAAVDQERGQQLQRTHD